MYRLHGQNSEIVKIFSEVEFCPSQIVVGIAQGKEIQVGSARLYMSELNQMFFSTKLFDSNFAFSKDNPSLLSFVFSKELEATDSDGRLVISRAFETSQSWGRVEYVAKPFVEFQFSNPKNIDNAIEKMASARNLLAFFADSILPLNYIEFSTPGQKLYEHHNLYFNYLDDGTVTKEPFMVSESAIGDIFPDVWTKWNDFYKNNIPVASLFYEIITDHSTGINRFLNLCQCLEVYSKRFRNKEAKAVKMSRNPEERGISLKHRIEDILTFCSPYLHFSSDKCQMLAKSISDARNYYTHYGKNDIVPSLDRICCSDILLHLVLLIIVYATLGIPSEKISFAIKCRIYSDIENISEDIL